MPTPSRTRATRRRPTKNGSGYRERSSASAAPGPPVVSLAGADRGDVDEPAGVVCKIGQGLRAGDDLARLQQREERAGLVHRVLDVLVELLALGVVRGAARGGAHLLQRRGGPGVPAGALPDQPAWQEDQVVVGVGVVGAPVPEAELLLAR